MNLDLDRWKSRVSNFFSFIFCFHFYVALCTFNAQCPMGFWFFLNFYFKFSNGKTYTVMRHCGKREKNNPNTLTPDNDVFCFDSIENSLATHLLTVINYRQTHIETLNRSTILSISICSAQSLFTANEWMIYFSLFFFLSRWMKVNAVINCNLKRTMKNKYWKWKQRAKIHEK